MTDLFKHATVHLNTIASSTVEGAVDFAIWVEQCMQNKLGREEGARRNAEKNRKRYAESVDAAMLKALGNVRPGATLLMPKLTPEKALKAMANFEPSELGLSKYPGREAARASLKRIHVRNLQATDLSCTPETGDSNYLSTRPST